MVIKGILVRCNNGRSKYSDEVKNRLSIKVEPSNIKWEEFDECYKDSGSKLTPEWVKKRTEYINVASKFDIPVRQTNGRETTVEDLIDTSKTLIGSEVLVVLNLKEGAVYPQAIKIVKDGEESDPFAEIDSEELPFK